MKTSDLKSGMVVELRNGSKYLVLRDTGIGGEQNDVMIHPYDGEGNGWMPISHYHDNLTCWGHDGLFDEGEVIPHSAFDIMKVWMPYHAVDIGMSTVNKLIFDRDGKEGNSNESL